MSTPAMSKTAMSKTAMSKTAVSQPATSHPALPAVSRQDGSCRLLIRGLAAVGLAGTALLHLVQLPDTWQQSPMLGAMFAALVAGATAAAAAMVVTDDRRLWQAAVLLAAAPIAGYILTRSIAVPFDSADVGNWLEPMGLASLFVEAALIALCTDVLLAWPRQRGDRDQSVAGVLAVTECS